MISVSKEFWIGIDLDGTLAFDLPGQDFNPLLIGEPIPEMVAIVHEHLANGDRVKIFTARAATIHSETVFEGSAEEYKILAVGAVKAWCLKHLGVELEVTCEKDYLLKLFYDDRAVRIKRNAGQKIGCVHCDP